MAEMDNLELKDNKELNVMGVNINIAEILGDKIAKEWIGSLSEEHMKAIFNYLTEEYFTVDKYTDEVHIKRKTDKWNPNGYLIDQVKTYFASATKEILLDGVNAIINSSSYKDRINEIANELVEYAIEGYKEDLKKELRTRLVDNVLSPEPSYGNVSLYSMVNSIIDSRFSR